MAKKLGEKNRFEDMKLEFHKRVREGFHKIAEEDKKRVQLLNVDDKSIEELQKDEFIRGVLGEHITDKYVKAKSADWTAYRAQVTEWEIEEYLYKI